MLRHSNYYKRKIWKYILFGTPCSILQQNIFTGFHLVYSNSSIIKNNASLDFVSCSTYLYLMYTSWRHLWSITVHRRTKKWTTNIPEKAYSQKFEMLKRPVVPPPRIYRVKIRYLICKIPVQVWGYLNRIILHGNFLSLSWPLLAKMTVNIMV